VVVEGIERPGQLEKVRNQVGAPLVQGYLLHRPMPLASVLSVVGANRQGLPPTHVDESPPLPSDSGEVFAGA
jgi:predicted signal transduction protein with EAL and GGDEF domain